MSQTYLQLAQQGKSHGWRYLLGAVLTLSLFFSSTTVIIMLLWAYVAVDNNPLTRQASEAAIAAGTAVVEGVSPLVVYVVYNLAFPFFLLGIYLSVRHLHQRSFLTLITPAARISWLRIAQGFVVFFLIKTAEILLGYWASPESFTINFQLTDFLLFVPFVLVLTPLQTATEELFFRGYLMQGTAARLGKWAAIILPSLLFMFLHLSNPEVTTQNNPAGALCLALCYLTTAVFLAWLTVKDNSLELAIGVHAANNIATLLLITSDNSVLPSPAVLNIGTVEANYAIVFYTAVGFWIFSFIVFRLLKKPVIR